MQLALLIPKSLHSHQVGDGIAAGFRRHAGVRHLDLRRHNVGFGVVEVDDDTLTVRCDVRQGEGARDRPSSLLPPYGEAYIM